MFIEVSVYTCISICVCIVFLKKKNSVFCCGHVFSSWSSVSRGTGSRPALLLCKLDKFGSPLSIFWLVLAWVFDPAQSPQEITRRSDFAAWFLRALEFAAGLVLQCSVVCPSAFDSYFCLLQVTVAPFRAAESKAQVFLVSCRVFVLYS
jgi:hypothetical protein